MVSRLPNVAAVADLAAWGTILNDYLSQEHNPDGSHTSRGRTWESFGGAIGANAATQAAAMAQAVTWWTANPGGTVIFGPGNYDNMPQIVLPVTGSGICGAGMGATRLKAVASLNADFCINHVSTGGSDPNAQFCRVENIWLDGNKAGQSAGNWRGIVFAVLPATTQATGDARFDSMNLIQNVYVTNTKGDGISSSGRSATLISHVDVYLCDGVGVSAGFDTWLHALNIGLSGTTGIAIAAPNVFATGCAAFYSGNVTPGSGAGWTFTSYHNNGARLVGCGAQDNKAYGYQINTVGMIQLAGCVADSNSTSGAGSFAAVDMFAGENCTLDVVCQDRQWNGSVNTQLNAIQARGGSINNRIRLVHYPAQGAIGVPVLSWSTDSIGNDVVIGGSGGDQHPAFAASFTPNPCLGGSIIVGTLTGNITINAVNAGNQWPGQVITFHLTQDATGGRTHTWNAAYHLSSVSGALPTTASKRNIISFQWDATAGFYVEIGRIVGV